MRLTGRGIWGEPPDREVSKGVLRRAVELGVNFIDTADSYGPAVSETLIAEALFPYPQDLVIATKGGLERSGPDVWPPNGRPEHLRAACESSLRRLRLEQIPLYQLHRPDPKVPYEESVGAIGTLKDEGKIRHVGVSNVTEEQLRRAQSVTPIVSVQNRYNLGDRQSDSLVDLCEQEALVFLPWAPIQDSAVAAPRSARSGRVTGATERQVVLAWLLRLTGDASDPGHQLGRSSRSERRGRRTRARPPRGRSTDPVPGARRGQGLMPPRTSPSPRQARRRPRGSRIRPGPRRSWSTSW